MKVFNYSKDLFIICGFESKRDGFNHTGQVFYKGRMVFKDKIHYQNRTWESFEFESILRACESWIDNNLKLEKFIKIAK